VDPQTNKNFRENFQRVMVLPAFNVAIRHAGNPTANGYFHCIKDVLF
jgi:hypothetical protein